MRHRVFELCIRACLRIKYPLLDFISRKYLYRISKNPSPTLVLSFMPLLLTIHF